MDQVNVTEPVSSPAVNKRSIAGALLHWARDLVFSVVLAIIVILFLYQPVKVEGTSMMPTLDDQERISSTSLFTDFILERSIAATRWCSGSRMIPPRATSSASSRSPAIGWKWITAP